jgi:hypothetical protein
MNKDQEDIFRMYRVALEVLKSNNAVWSGNIPFGNAVAELENNIDDLEELREQQMEDIKGITDEKKARRILLEDLSYKVETIVVFYATSAGNEILLALVDYNRSDYTLARDSEVVGISMQVHKAAAANAAALLPFGLTASMITSLQNAIDSFSEYIDEPKSARSDAAEATKAIPKAIRQTTKLLKQQVDKGMELFRTTNPDFYAKYFKARKIVNTARLRRALKATFVNAENNKAIEKVKVKIDGKIKRSSSAKGTIYVQHLAEGKHTLEASRSDGSVVKKEFNVIKRETTKLVVKL